MDRSPKSLPGDWGSWQGQGHTAHRRTTVVGEQLGRRVRLPGCFRELVVGGARVCARRTCKMPVILWRAKEGRRTRRRNKSSIKNRSR